MESEIKLCPFCGGEAALNVKWNFKANCWFVFVKCEMCGATSKTVSCKERIDEDENLSELSSGKAAIRAWNKEFKGER